MGFYSPTSCALPFTDELPLSGLLSEFSVAKLLPKTMNSSHYRFPAQGQSYIEIPHEAFRNQGECSCGAGSPGPSLGRDALALPRDLGPCRVAAQLRASPWPLHLFLQEQLWARFLSSGTQCIFGSSWEVHS